MTSRVGDRTGEFHHHGGDLSDPKQIEDLYKFTQDKFSQTPDILVNNAGQSAGEDGRREKEKGGERRGGS